MGNDTTIVGEGRPGPRAAVRRSARIAARGAATAIVAVVGWQTARAVNALLSGPAPVLSRAAIEAETGARRVPTPADWLAPEAGGSWWFAGARWRWSAAWVGADEVARHLARPPEDPEPVADDPAAEDLLRLVHRLAHTSTPVGAGGTAYSLSMPRRKIMALTTFVGGRERLAALRVALPEGDSWRVYALEPGGGRDADVPLLPLPPEVRRLGQRLDARGEAVCDILSIAGGDKALEGLHEHWRRLGWSVDHWPALGRGAVVCMRGGESVLARPLAPDGDGRMAVMIIREEWAQHAGASAGPRRD